MALTHYEAHKWMSQLDIPQVLSEVFSNQLLLGGGIKVAAVSAVGIFRMRMMLQGQLTPEDDTLLKQVLSQHLEISQWSSRVWIQPKPDVDELVRSWEAQTQSMKRWELFETQLNRHSNVAEAYQVAFLDFEPDALQFSSEADRHHWEKLLHMEQQRMIAQNQHEVQIQNDLAPYWEDSCLVFQGQRFKLSPSEIMTLQALWDGQWHTSKSLIRRVLGSKSPSRDNIFELSRRISMANKKLLTLWGVPPQPGKHWIIRQPEGDEMGYRLSKPNV